MGLSITDLFKTIILIQLFYSFGITTLTYSLPEDTLNYVSGFSEITETVNLENTAAEVEESIRDQTNIPAIELGALIFYSGNILIDLLLNFAFALPQMLAMLVNGIMMLFSINSQIFITVQLFASVLIITIYFISLIQLIASIRSGRVIT